MYVPGEHGVGAVEPTPHALPAVQLVHSLLAASAALLEYVPAGHGSAADAPSSQYEPASQPMQPVAPLADW